MRPECLDQRERVHQVARMELDAVHEVVDALEGDRGGPAHHADHVVSLVQQQLGQVGAVLSRDACDEGAALHGGQSASGSRRRRSRQ